MAKRRSKADVEQALLNSMIKALKDQNTAAVNDLVDAYSKLREVPKSNPREGGVGFLAHQVE